MSTLLLSDSKQDRSVRSLVHFTVETTKCFFSRLPYVKNDKSVRLYKFFFFVVNSRRLFSQNLNCTEKKTDMFERYSEYTKMYMSIYF